MAVDYFLRCVLKVKTIVIIQARMGSTRLPGKIFKPLGDEVILSYVVKRCKAIQGVDDVIVATSTLSQDDVVEKWCNENDVAVCRGSEDDVLSRYVQCAKTYNPNYIMRVTADCPFVDYELASEVVKFMKERDVEIVDLKGDMPRGLAVELLTFNALKRIDQQGKLERHREHVTYYAYEFKDKFSRASFIVPQNRTFPKLRITLDTEEDYKLCQGIATHFNNPLVSSVEVINFLLENPSIAKLNAHIKQKPVV